MLMLKNNTAKVTSPDTKVTQTEIPKKAPTPLPPLLEIIVIIVTL